MVGAVINFLGVPAGLIGNELSIRYGLRTIATLVFVLSAVAGGLFGFTAMLPYIAVLGLSVVIGFIVQGNFQCDRHPGPSHGQLDAKDEAWPTGRQRSQASTLLRERGA